MKITWEVGDYVMVEDNMKAGPAANCMLRLISKSGSTWVGKVEEGFDETEAGQLVSVEERFIHPAF